MASSHFLYSGDTLLVCRGTSANIQQISGAITLYSALSCQDINRLKSNIYIHYGISAFCKLFLSHRTGMEKGSFLFTYLGSAIQG